MAITVEEKYGRRLAGNTHERTYIVRGTLDDEVAFTALLEQTPTERGELLRKDDEIELEEIEGVVSGAWLATVPYGVSDQGSGGGSQPQAGDSSFAFETRGGTQHVTQSLATVGRYKSPSVAGNAPNFGGAIGVEGDTVQGVDITVPIYTFNETHYFATEAVTNLYKAALFNLTGRVNNAAFRGLAEGECLFLGAAGSLRTGDPGLWEIGFAFAGSPNVSNLTIGDITGIAKKGWEYLWTLYQTAEDTDAKMLVRKPIAAYIEQVYRYGDFTGLGIGS